MKQEVDLIVPVQVHFDTFELDDTQRKVAMDILLDADALIEKNGNKCISTLAYAEYTRFRLNEIRQLAEHSQSLKDLHNYEFLCQYLMREWTIIIGNLSRLLAEGYYIESMEDSERTLKC